MLTNINKIKPSHTITLNESVTILKPDEHCFISPL